MPDDGALRPAPSASGERAQTARAASAKSVTPAAPTASESERQLSAVIEPVPTSMMYVITLGVVAVTMVVLPVAYIALAGLVGYLVYQHSLNAGEWLSGGSHARIGIRGGTLYYVGGLAIGGIVLFFMVKPLFAPRGRRMRPYSVEVSEAPGLHRLVRGIATAVGAPVPTRIDINCDANASASFRKGFLSFLGNDLVLTIGLPLVACMGTRQLAGVIAHELGHFTQGAGMRLTFVISCINTWFARVVYARDAWDERLDDASRDGGFHIITLIVWLTQLSVWTTRRVLWLLMKIGQLISSFAIRQMEYDADRYENRVAGTKAFAGTFVRLHGLAIAEDRVHGELGKAWFNGGNLVDNIPGAIAVRFHQTPPEAIEKIKERMRSEKTGFFDTHPSPRDRIRAVQKAACEGIVRDDRPATGLFKSLDLLCKAATRVFYLDVLGRSIPDEALRPVDFLTDEQGPSNVAAAAKVSRDPEGDIPLA